MRGKKKETDAGAPYKIAFTHKSLEAVFQVSMVFFVFFFLL